MPIGEVAVLADSHLCRELLGEPLARVDGVELGMPECIPWYLLACRLHLANNVVNTGTLRACAP